MLIFRQELWGRDVFDLDDDDIWVEVRSGESKSRIDRPFSAICLLNQPVSVRAESSGSPGQGPWPPILDRLRAAGLMRLSLVGLESLPRSEALEFVRAAHGREMGVVALAGDCTADLKSLVGFPVKLGLQVLLEPGTVLKDEGMEGISRRLETLGQLVESGLSVRVLTSYDPASPLLLTELGEKFDRVGIPKWLIYPRNPNRGGESRLIEAALEEVRALSRDIPWLSVQYGCFLERELDVLIYPDGSVEAREGRAWPTIKGNVDQLAAGTLLPKAFLDRHVDLWVSAVMEYEEVGVPVEDSMLEWAEKPELPDHEVFLCYRRKDWIFALSLYRRLKAAGIPVWMDDIKLQAGDHWQQVIEKALEQSRVVVICVGPSGLGDFQQREVGVALKLESEGALKVMPVILPGVVGESAIPPFLRALHYVDFRRTDINPFERLLSGIRSFLKEKERDAAVDRHNV